MAGCLGVEQAGALEKPQHSTTCETLNDANVASAELSVGMESQLPVRASADGSINDADLEVKQILLRREQIEPQTLAQRRIESHKLQLEQPYACLLANRSNGPSLFDDVRGVSQRSRR